MAALFAVPGGLPSWGRPDRDDDLDDYHYDDHDDDNDHDHDDGWFRVTVVTLALLNQCIAM